MSGSGAAGLSITAKILLGFGGLSIVCATAVAIVYISRPEVIVEAPPVETPNRVISAENVTEITTEVKDKVARAVFETHMNTTWRFPDGSSPSRDAIMGNAASNQFDFYFTITLATGETVFTSGLIPVGSLIDEIKLETELEAGTYPAVVNINMVDDEGEPVDSNMGINVTLIIES